MLRTIVILWLIVNVALAAAALFAASRAVRKLTASALIYQGLIALSAIMLLPFYWMIVTSFKDAATAATFPPVWLPAHTRTLVKDPATGELRAIVPLGVQQKADQLIKVVPEEHYGFRTIDDRGVQITKEAPDEKYIFEADPKDFIREQVIDGSLKNFARAWYRPEETSRGQVNFLDYFELSLLSSLIATLGTLFTSALAAFAFARFDFYGKNFLFYLILATMMVPGQVLLIPNFLTLSTLNLLNSLPALTLPWLASVFTIFLMRQFFMTIPEDLWDAARIDGASRFRYLWQIVVPLSKPVFVTSFIFAFLENWNSLLWPLIVTSSPKMRTMMVGLQNLSEDASSEFHILMAASCFAILPIVVMFFFMQRFFIEGIARTGLK